MALFSTFLTWRFWRLGPADRGWPSRCRWRCRSWAAPAIERVLIRPVGEVEHNPLALVIVTIGMFLALNALVGLDLGHRRPALPQDLPGGHRRHRRRLDLVSGARHARRAGRRGRCCSTCCSRDQARPGHAGGGHQHRVEPRWLGIRVGPDAHVRLGAGRGGRRARRRCCTRSEPRCSTPTSSSSCSSTPSRRPPSAASTVPLGAVVGGLIVGSSPCWPAATSTASGEDLKLVAAFALILVVLLVRPQGLFGTDG